MFYSIETMNKTIHFSFDRTFLYIVEPDKLNTFLRKYFF